MKQAITGLAMAVLALCGAGRVAAGMPPPQFEFVAVEPVGVKTGKHQRVTFQFPAERIGYFTVKGERKGEGLVAADRYVAQVADALEMEDVAFHRAVCPIDLSSVSFACSDGNLAAFWADCLRLTENRVIARKMGDKELEERFAAELKSAFAAAMPNADESANPLGVIVRQYLGVKADKEKRTVEVFPKLVQGMTRMAGTVPTALGMVAVDARHLRGDDYTIDVEIPMGARAARLVTPAWGESAELDGAAATPQTINYSDGKKRYAFRLGGGKHTVVLRKRRDAASPCVFPAPATAYDLGKIQLEKLDRGLVAVRDKHHAIVSWRYLPSDPTNIAFKVYENGRLITKEPLTGATFLRTKYRTGATYRVEVAATGESAEYAVADAPYIKVPLKPMREGYWTEEASVGDLTGDGRYDFVVKRTPLDAKDNAQAGATGVTLLDAVTLDGRHLWRIDLGPNIRSGAHYTQFMVYDFDGDGKAEVICKTADGTVDGTGKVIGDAKARWAEKGEATRGGRAGKVLDGPEYLTVFDGATGAALDTVPYDPPRGNIVEWGDDYGNRCDRFLACVAYLDGIHPSAVFSRGYYAKTVLVAWDWDGKRLKKRWRFDSSTPGNEAYAGQGFHSVRVGDVDFDGKDEIVFGAMVVDHDGKGLYSTGLGHGDGQHLVQARPDMRGLQVWTCHEHPPAGLVFRYAGDDKIIWQQKRGYDVPTCVAADFDPTNPGMELWMGKGEPYWDVYGRELQNYGHIGWARDLAWWKGDMLRSRIDNGRKLYHWDYEAKRWKFDPILRTDASGVKKMPFPVIVADILGDWREEIVTTTDSGNALSIFVSPQPTPYRFWTFMADPMYRTQVAAWVTAYNQAPQPGFYFGPDLLGHDIWFRGCHLP